MTMARQTVIKVLALLLAPVLLFACDPFGLRDLLEAAARSPLSINPTVVTLPASTTFRFSAVGGVPGYAYSVTGDGDIDVDTGMYSAWPSAGAATIRVTDAAGAWVESDVTIEDLSTGLTLSPSSFTITVNGHVDFEAIGGTGTYTFSILTAGIWSAEHRRGHGRRVHRALHRRWHARARTRSRCSTESTRYPPPSRW